MWVYVRACTRACVCAPVCVDDHVVGKPLIGSRELRRVSPKLMTTNDAFERVPALSFYQRYASELTTSTTDNRCPYVYS